MNYLENRIKTLLSKARQLEIKAAQHQLEWGTWEFEKENDHPPQYLLDGDEELVKPFHQILKSIYLSTICYLDQKNLDNYLEIFYRTFGKDTDNLKNCDRFEIDHYWSGEPYSVFLADLNRFLSSFEFTESNEEKYERIAGIQYLETILRNTAVIISKNNKSPKSEADVYKAVRSTLEVIFTSSKSPKSNFIKTAKEYFADILIPELYAAVEYKYAADEQKLKATIEQILIDAKAYTGDKDYSIFYAVFYVTEDFWGQAKLNKFWDDLGFPKNWIPIYVVGKS